MVQRPAFAAIVILTLAVGIGANSAVFSVVSGVLLQPLPFKTPNQLVGIRETLPDEASDPLAYRTYAEFRDRNRLLDSIAATASWNFNVQFGDSGARVPGMRVTASYFTVMGLNPVLGRGFQADEQQPGAEPVAIIDSDRWQRYFGGTLDVLTRRITLDLVRYRIVGVMPDLPELKDTGWAGLWTPLYKDDQKERLNPGRYLNVIGRLKPNVSVEQSQAELARIMSLLRRDFPETHGKQYGVLVRSLAGFVVPEGTRAALLILLGVVGFVLLIACSNVANLML
ncbi:MAG: ABC transporter permease, partial [Blastocatellia bacterium]